MVDISFSDSSENIYWQYVQTYGSKVDFALAPNLADHIRNRSWEDPQSALDFNNAAVIALIEAEKAENLSERSIYWEIALESLKEGVKLQDHPLCKAHSALFYSLLGEIQISVNIAYSALLEILQKHNGSEPMKPLGMVYLPTHLKKWKIVCKDQLQHMLQVEDGNMQALLLVSAVLCQTGLAFYHHEVLQFLQLAVHFSPASSVLNLQLGVSGVHNQQWESLAYLHRARKLDPEDPKILQALYLAYRDLNQLSVSEEWQTIAGDCAQKNDRSVQWGWTDLPANSLFTYIPFEDRLLLAVEPSLRSIVTCVLLAQGDWFEAEMELWRDRIQPGMTVIDVGANVGVYTFSAAQRVGKSGKAIAIEPFSGCVRCLEETRRVNQLEWVSIHAGAASDRHGTAQLSLNSASELNELAIAEDSTSQSGRFETVACFTLDSLIERENLSRVDWLKLDAEGHEMQILAGSERLLKEFAPSILYENVAVDRASNTAVADFLQQQGYQLFRYRPHLKQLLPIHSAEELQGNLNLIALPPSAHLEFTPP
ncbi:FkbM family methyltransferase [Tumidithrix helvetica PCC 7403]|uniref:FkbM family methyltransferase n=1 Tax=Tumidithrix helvetica TaxID=3457545 RepID=UPI003C8F5650